MSRHATAEVLSAYLDDELAPARALQVEAHLEGCVDCRDQFASLNRVVADLRRLERAAPPPLLAHQVQRRIALGGRSPTTLERLGERLERLRQPSSVFFTFALIFALATILYLFAAGVERAQRPRTMLVVTSEPPLTGEVMETREAASRRFDLVDGRWIEQGVSVPASEMVVVPAGSLEGRQLLELYPDLAALGERIVLEVEGAVVELRGAPGVSD